MSAIDSEHYLQRELYERVRTDPRIFDFLEAGSLDGVWYWDLEHPEEEWMSPRFWRVLGYDPALMPHKSASWQALVFAEDRDVALEGVRRHLQDPSRPFEQVVRYRHADGSTAWVRCRGVAISDADGRPIRMLGAHNDLTRFVEQQSDNLRMSEVNEEMRQFAYAVSHDMKAPANSILQALTIALEEAGSLEGDARRMVEMAMAAAERIRTLVEETLKFSRVVNARPTAETFDPAAIARVICDEALVTLRSLGGAITLAGEPGAFSGYPALFQILLQNLIQNAIKYRRPETPPRITVELQTSVARGVTRLAIAVADNGIGIAPEHHERIFGLFERLHRHDEIPGAGLGLAICQRIARKHEGELRVASALGQGATFTATLQEIDACPARTFRS